MLKENFESKKILKSLISLFYVIKYRIDILLIN